jgi:hypothetical protein
MQICIVGWHYNKELIELMETVHKTHPVHIVAHRQGPYGNLPTTLIENIGLEFHCYDYFIRNLWDGKSNVLLMHDDIVINPVFVNYEIIPPINIFNKLSKLPLDQAYIFQDDDDAEWNNYKHGRMIYLSAKLAGYLKENGGIGYDESNRGNTRTGFYNLGISQFHDNMLDLRKQFDTCNLGFCPSIVPLRRNGEVDQSINAVVEERENERHTG